MKRREFVTSVIAGGLAAPVLAEEGHTQNAEAHAHARLLGPLANATVSFGFWQQFDRFPNNNDRTRNGHALLPHVALIKAGGTVNFIIGGFHHVLVYAPGTKPEHIQSGMTVPVTNPPGPPLINDPTNRLYRGLDPSLFPQDRVEVVGFPNKGLHLVICGVQPHFVNDDMYGWVQVV